MRLFIAVLFHERIETALFDTVIKLRNTSLSGTFTRKENLHLTVNFIGETKRIDEVKTAMEQAVHHTDSKRFVLSIQGFGKFKRREGDIYWVGVEREETLWRLQRELVKELKEAGFYDIDDMNYTPHLTLGRRVKVNEKFQMHEFEAGITPLTMEVARLSLMKSERIDGKLVYTEIYHVNLD
jgi:RNA 2',3'-cyclic 3'-phosphodiesterase